MLTRHRVLHEANFAAKVQIRGRDLHLDPEGLFFGFGVFLNRSKRTSSISEFRIPSRVRQARLEFATQLGGFLIRISCLIWKLRWDSPPCTLGSGLGLGGDTVRASTMPTRHGVLHEANFAAKPKASDGSFRFGLRGAIFGFGSFSVMGLGADGSALLA
jgi:hypothetical protein